MNPIQIEQIHHIQICIPTGEENKARQFYSHLLGLEEIEKPHALKANGGLWYKAGDIELHIGTETYSGNSKRHPAFVVENLDQIKSYLTQQNVSIKEETQIPGMKRFSFYDPFQNRIEFVELTTS